MCPPICDATLLETIEKAILLPTITGMESEGRLFQGILYAGLMITENGPKVLEFNCRFGDPETQVLLPLLYQDLLEIIMACITGSLEKVNIQWKDSTCVSVVLASGGYPNKYETGQEIFIDRLMNDDWLVFHAGTSLANGQPVTSGGRVLNVTASAPTIAEAVKKVYQAVEHIHFKGMIYRKDIARKAVNPVLSSEGQKQSAYSSSGVDIDAGNRAVNLMRNSVRSTYTPAVLAGIGSFGGLFDASSLKNYHHPVLVASTDGVGTKVRLAAQFNRYESIGQDIVNHCINDILVQGAVPLFFLDYFACSKLDPMVAARIVSGISTACREAGCVLIGGETAEMPGVYEDGEFDLAGTIVGVVEKERVLPRDTIRQGDLLVGFESSGPHTNGYSLIRKVLQGYSLDSPQPGSDISMIDALLKPHRSYLTVLEKVLQSDPISIKALAHITGGGFIENIPRILPDGLQAVIRKGSWMIPPIFKSIQQAGDILDEEMYRVFNMGIGMVAVVAPDDIARLQQQVSENCWVIGQLVDGKKGVAFL